MKRNNEEVVLGCGFFLISCAFAVLMCWLCMEMFEYSFYSMFGKDMAWYLDLIGALIFNGINLPIWFICFVLRTVLGWETPFFEGN